MRHVSCARTGPQACRTRSCRASTALRSRRCRTSFTPCATGNKTAGRPTTRSARMGLLPEGAMEQEQEAEAEVEVKHSAAFLNYAKGAGACVTALVAIV